MTTTRTALSAAALLLMAGCYGPRYADGGYAEPTYPPPDACDPAVEACPGPTSAPYCPPGAACQPYGYAPGPYGPPPEYGDPEHYGRGGGREDEERGERGRDGRHEARPAPPRDGDRGGEARGPERRGDRDPDDDRR